MNAGRVAYVDAFLALAEWRALSDVEALVSQWVIERLASHEDLVAARSAANEARKAHVAARRRYTRILGMRSQSRPGRGAGYNRLHRGPLSEHHAT